MQINICPKFNSLADDEIHEVIVSGATKYEKINFCSLCGTMLEICKSTSSKEKDEKPVDTEPGPVPATVDLTYEEKELETPTSDGSVDFSLANVAQDADQQDVLTHEAKQTDTANALTTTNYVLPNAQQPANHSNVPSRTFVVNSVELPGYTGHSNATVVCRQDKTLTIVYTNRLREAIRTKVYEITSLYRYK